MLRMLWLMLASTWTVFWRRRRHGPRRPTWSLRFEALIATMRRDSDERESWPVARSRKHLSRLPGPRDALRKVRRQEVAIGSLTGVWMTADRTLKDDALTAGDVLLFLHGGSFLFGSVRDTHADIIARLALATGAPTLGVDYRLAPEHPYPAALQDAVAAYDWLLERGVSPDRIVLAGDSSGGNLAIALLVHLRENDRELPRAAALMSPWVDLLCRRPSMERNADHDFGTRAMLVSHAEYYAGDLSPGDARISVIDADLGGLPPLYIQFGGAELLEDECRDLADRARVAGVRVEVDTLRDMPHNGQLFAAYAPEGARAITRAAEFIKAAWRGETNRATTTDADAASE